MTLPITFAGLPGPIPLSQLDQNFTYLDNKFNGIYLSSNYATLQLGLTAAAGGSFVIVPGTYAITTPLTPANNTEIVIQGGATITGNVADMVLINASSKSGVVIRGPGTVQNLATGTGSGGGSVGVISLQSATDCLVDGVRIVGQTWAGVLLNASTRCRVQNCKITSAIGALQDSADVMIYGTCTSCEVVGNHCNSGSHTGILMQDPYAGLLPQANKVYGNWINSHTAYGIALYLPGVSGSGDTNNLIAYNYISGTLGSFTTNRDSGNGIYAAGAYIGGTQIIGNLVRNSCSQTLTRTLAPGGIGINGVAAGTARVLINGNTISDNTQGDGINVSSCPGGVVIGENVITLPTGNDGTGAGGANLLGSGIRIEVSSKVEVTGGDVTVLGGGSGVFLYANGADQSTIGVVGGRYETASGATIRVERSAAFVTSGLRLDGLNVRNTGSSNYGISMTGVAGGTVSNCIAYAGSFEALRMSACTSVRVTGGNITGGTNPVISTSGTCTGSFIDASVYWGTSAAGMNNAGTGCGVTWRTTAVPGAGTWAQGDHWIQTASTSGAAPGGYCTVAGTPGTWKNEANLA